jgi:hypothetical protein
LSFGASGQIGKTLVYGSWKGRPYARRYVIPANPNSTDQQETRNTFKWLNNVYKFMPTAAAQAWELYGQNNRFTARNGFIKQNLSNLREEADLTNFLFSPSAGGGLVAAGMVATGGNDQVTVDLTAPSLPAGWTIVEAVAAVIRQQDPQSGLLYEVTAGTDATSTYQIVLTGLASAETYVVGGWFKYAKSSTEFAYGQALMDTALTT